MKLTFSARTEKNGRFSACVVHFPGIGSAKLADIALASGIGTGALGHRVKKGYTDPAIFLGIAPSPGAAIKPRIDWEDVAYRACGVPNPKKAQRSAKASWGFAS